MNAIVEDLTKNTRELCILEIVKEFDLKYREAAVIVDARSMLDNLAKTNDADETWDALVDVVFANIKASFNMTDERFNEIYEFIDLVELDEN